MTSPSPELSEWERMLRQEWVSQRKELDSRLLSMSWGTLAGLGGALLTAKQLDFWAVTCGVVAGIGLLVAVGAALVGMKKNSDYIDCLLRNESHEGVKRALAQSDSAVRWGFGIGLFAACCAVAFVAASKLDGAQEQSKPDGGAKEMAEKKRLPGEDWPRKDWPREDSLDGLERLKPEPASPVQPQQDKPPPSEGKK